MLRGVRSLQAFAKASPIGRKKVMIGSLDISESFGFGSLDRLCRRYSAVCCRKVEAVSQSFMTVEYSTESVSAASSVSEERWARFYWWQWHTVVPSKELDDKMSDSWNYYSRIAIVLTHIPRCVPTRNASYGANGHHDAPKKAIFVFFSARIRFWSFAEGIILQAVSG